jgi:hypothetical protein
MRAAISQFSVLEFVSHARSIVESKVQALKIVVALHVAKMILRSVM